MITPKRSKRNHELEAVRVRLSSQRPSDVWRGMDQVRRWLGDDPENREVYGMLLDAVKENRDLREQVRKLLSEMEQKGSKSAHEAISYLPTSVQDISADANDAYYAGEYERAIQLYRQVLKLDPNNAHAKDHIAKAEIKRRTGETASGLPRAAEQYYRRARSFITAREVVTAMNLLSAAIEAARAKDMKYPEAEEALNNMNNLLLADDFKQKARTLLEKGQRKEAISLYEKALRLDPTDKIMRGEIIILQRLENPVVEKYMSKASSAVKAEHWGVVLDSYNKSLILMHPYASEIKESFARIAGLIRATVLLNSVSEQTGSILEKDRTDRLYKIGELLDIAEREPVLKKSNLLRRSRARYSRLTGKGIGQVLLSFLRRNIK